MLEGQVEVGNHLVGADHGVDQGGTHLGRLQVAHSDPVQPVHRRQLAQQLFQQAQVTQVLAVGRGVLADQEGLLDALRDQPLGLGDHLVDRTGEVAAAEGGNRAEGAAPVAAGGELQRRGRRVVQAPAQHARSAGRGDSRWQLRVVPGDGHRGRGFAALHGRDGQQCATVARDVGNHLLAVLVEAEHGIGLRHRLGEFPAVALGHAPDGDDGLDLAVPLQVGGGHQRVDGVLLGLLDEAAGVHHHGVGLIGFVDQAEAAGLKPGGEFLGVGLVAGATQADEVDGGQLGLRGGVAHRPPVSPMVPHPPARAGGGVHRLPTGRRQQSSRPPPALVGGSHRCRACRLSPGRG